MFWMRTFASCVIYQQPWIHFMAGIWHVQPWNFKHRFPWYLDNQILTMYSKSYSGLEEVTLYPIEQCFHSLYCYAEKEVGPSEISRLKLMDENGNVIMHVNGFAVSWTVVLHFKDVSLCLRNVGYIVEYVHFWISYQVDLFFSIC